MLDPQTYELTEEELWALVEEAVQERDAFLAQSYLYLLAD